jgi:hypothetical protein
MIVVSFAEETFFRIDEPQEKNGFVARFATRRGLFQGTVRAAFPPLGGSMVLLSAQIAAEARSGP